MPSRWIVPVPVRTRGLGTSSTDHLGPVTTTFTDLPMTIIRQYVATCGVEFRNQAAVETSSLDVQ